MQWTPEQQKEHRKLWVEALRSGKYEQAKEVLRQGNGSMCCLGVACEISGLGRWDPAGDYCVTESDYAPDVLPHAVQEWLGLRDNGGEFGDGRALYKENDNRGKTFAELADIIVAEPVGLIAPVEVL